MSIEEATVSNMWEIAAGVDVLEGKGLSTNHERRGKVCGRILVP